ncbi:MAG: orotidine-5'-phosphate decarboxylase [Lachnospiraceae bacterium]|nr:orotidine-5'-phosphate decarboxylase [Lachnospiraceae bacterium]
MINRLIEEIKKKEAPIVVGLDPQLSFLPEHLLETAKKEAGEGLEAVAAAVLAFNRRIIDATYDLIPAVKPQIAMYEQFGIPGLIAYKETVDYAKKKGLVVIADVKRGDIGSTSAAYADAHLGSVSVFGKTFEPFGADMATVNPYLGSDGVKPFLDVCKEHDKGIFILVKTSNPSSGEFQDKKLGKKTLYEQVGQMVEKWGEDLREGQYSNVGAVVGATYPEVGKQMRKAMPHTYILVPGYGAQGGKGEDLAVFFDKDGLGAIVNSSRGIIAAYKNEAYSKYKEEGFDEASRAAVLDMKKDILGAIGKK